MEGDKKYKKIIDRLSILLCISLVALGGIEIYKQYKEKELTSMVASADENIITPEEEIKTDSTTNEQDDNSETNNINSVSEVSNETTNEVNNQTNNGVTNESNQDLIEEDSEILSLHKKHASDNYIFNVSNMFPGDAVTNNYCIKVSYKDSVTVRFGVDVHDGYEKLSEAMKIKVVLSTTGETLYDGYIKDMPKSLNHTLSTTDTSDNEELYYKVTAYLDTSVGNEYMGKDLKLNFKWWVEEEDNLQQAPSIEGDTNITTGDDTNIVTWSLLMVGSLLILILLYSKRKKEAK